jgi:hypothetical protein
VSTLTRQPATRPDSWAAQPSVRGGQARWLPPAWTITAVCALAYVIAAPPSRDLAAASYRSDLFAHAGFTLWDNAWYGGHHLLAYSALAPGLGALLGPQLLAALSMTAATALFTALIAGRFPARATTIAAIWFAFGASIGLLANRVAFDLGLALGLGALLAAQSASAGADARRALALVLAALCALASPIAGAFLALAALAWTLAGRRPLGWFRPALVLAALAPIALLALAFPEGGTEPFVASAFYPTLAGVLLLGVAIPSEQRVLRTGVLLYAAALITAYVLPTAVGGNADRLGALLAGPIAACALIGRTRASEAAGSNGRDRDARGNDARGGDPAAGHARWRTTVLIVLAPFLIYWQALAPLADFVSARSDPAVAASFYTPLLGELRARGVGFGSPARIEVVPTRDHWEARWVAPEVMIARGWERQLDTDRDSLFYDKDAPLSAARYHAWLHAQAVSYVALPDSPLDYASKAEARVVRSAPDYLREVWRSAHWRLFAVTAATPLAQPPSVLTKLTSDSFTLLTPRAGTFTTRMRFTPYWALASGHGCVRRAPGGWTEVQARGAGSLHVVIDFSLTRVFARGARCR